MSDEEGKYKLRQQIPEEEADEVVDVDDVQNVPSDVRETPPDNEESSVDIDTSEYAHTLDVKKLPSQGVLYNFDIINLREFRPPEVDKLDNTNLMNFHKVIRSVTQNCIDRDLQNFTYGDVMYLFLYIRINTYSPYLPWEVDCPNSDCGNKITNYKYDLRKVNLNKLDEDYEEPQVFKLGDKTVKMRMLRVRHVERIENILRNNLDKFNRDEASLNLAARRACMIDEATDCGNSITDKIRWVDEELDSKELHVISAFIKKNAHGIDQTVDIECGNCGNQFTRPLPFKQELLVPSPDEVDLDEYRVT